jgi:competence protein ComEC
MSVSPWRCRLFKTPLAARLEKLHLQTLLRYVLGAVVVSLSVQLVLLPFLILYFHRLSPPSILLNIIVGVLMAILSFCAMAAMLLSGISEVLAAPLISLSEGLNWLMIYSVDPFATLRLASIRLPEYHGAAAVIYGLYYLPVVVLMSALARWKPIRSDLADGTRTRRRLTVMAGVGWTVATILIIAHPWSAGTADGRLHIDFLDVGQGDAALVTLPDGTTMLIDAGGRPRFQRARADADEEDAGETFERDGRSIGEAVVSEYLWWRGLATVDYLVATHGHADHIDGLNDVARNFKVRNALVARTPAANAEYARLAATLRSERASVHVIGRGDSLHFGRVTIDVLWPVETSDADATSGNEDSLVLRLRFGERVFLLTGDVENRSETALATMPDDLRADLVKVAHHGSRSSSIDSFVDATGASLAIISVGLTSMFGHPHQEVIDRWRAHGARIMTTGESGTISVSTDGKDLRVETFVK